MMNRQDWQIRGVLWAPAHSLGRSEECCQDNFIVGGCSSSKVPTYVSCVMMDVVILLV